MKKIIYFLLTAIVALGFASCSNDEDCLGVTSSGVKVKISIAGLDNDGEGTRAIKKNWAVGDKLNIWFDGTYWTQLPQLVLTYNGTEWTPSDVNSSELNPTGQFFVIYEASNSMFNSPISNTFAYFPQGEVREGESKVYAYSVPLSCYRNNVAYTFSNNELSANISDWEFMTRLQVVITDLPKGADKYALKINDVENTAAYWIDSRSNIVSPNGQSTNRFNLGVPNEDGVAFSFGSSLNKNVRDITFTLQDIESGTEVEYVKKSTELLLIDNSKIKAIKIPYSKFVTAKKIADEDTRLYYGITYQDNQGFPSTLSYSLFGNYNIEVNLPGTSQSGIGAAATGYSISFIHDDEHIGSTEPLMSEQIMNTGINGVYISMPDMLSYFFNFTGCSFPVKVVDNGTEISGLVYNFNPQIENNIKIIGTANDRNKAQAVWSKILSHIDITKNTGKESFIVLPKGTKWHIGDETLAMQQDINLPLTSDRYYYLYADELCNDANVKIISGEDDKNLISYTFPAGTIIALDGVKIVFNTDTKITYDISALDLSISEIISTNLANVKSAGSRSAYILYLLSINIKNQIIGMFDACEEVPVTIEFTNFW